MSNSSDSDLLNYGLTSGALAVYAILGVFTVLSNGVFMLVIWRHRHLKTDTNAILFSLAFSDILVGAIVTPLNIINFLSVFYINEILCVALNTCVTCVPLVSLFHLLAVAGERYVGIIYSIHHSRIVTTKRTLLVLIACWTFGVIIGVLPVFGWNRLQERQMWNDTDRVCIFTLVFPSGYIQMFVYVLMSVYVLVCVMYVRIFAVAIEQAKRVSRSLRCRVPVEVKRARHEVNVIVVFFITVGYFLVSYLPACIMCLQLSYGYETDAFNWRVVLFLAFTNSALNPFIYGLGNRPIRRAFVAMFCNCRSRRNNDLRPNNQLQLESS